MAPLSKEEEKKQELDKINEELFGCRACSFYNDPALEGIPFRPDLPIYDLDKRMLNEHRFITIGINPSPAWKTYNDHWKDVYDTHTPDDYREKAYGNKLYKKGRYIHVLSEILTNVNKAVKAVSTEELTPENTYDYTVGANLSFCCSQKPNRREINGKIFKIDVYSKEIPNCLTKGYLARLVKLIQPSAILFLSTKIDKIKEDDKLLSDKGVISKILGCSVDAIEDSRPEKYPMNKRYEPQITAYRVNGNTAKIFVFPHPTIPLSKENEYQSKREEAIRKLCSWLRQ